MEESTKRHIELPSDEGINDLTPQDQLVYLGIRSYMNKDTLKAWPSQSTIAQRIGCCDKTVRKCIKNLVDNNYIKVEKEGKKLIYIFNKLKLFEPFSYEFLEDKNISFTLKALLASTLQYMYDKESGIGKVSFSKMELAEKINMPYPTLVKATRELSKLNIIDTVKLDDKLLMQFNLLKYHQGIVRVLLNHEERLENTENRIESVEERLNRLEQENKELRKKLNFENEITIC